jgi:hypothetical protein
MSDEKLEQERAEATEAQMNQTQAGGRSPSAVDEAEEEFLGFKHHPGGKGKH